MSRVAEQSEQPPAGKPSAKEAAFFTKEVLPVLEANCFKCHGGGKSRGGLSLQPPLVLHGETGHGFTRRADVINNGGGSLFGD